MNKTISSAIHIVSILTLLAASSCSDFLKEEALDFKSSTNSFNTNSDFELSVTNLYRLVRNEFFSGGEQQTFDYVFGTDLVYDGQIQGAQRFNDFDNTCNPNNTYLNSHWNNLYKVIAESNTIIRQVNVTCIGKSFRLF